MRVPLIYKDAPQFGFDIGTHSVKVVQLRGSGRNPTVQAYGECYFPREAITEGIIVDPALIAKTVKPFLQKLPYGNLTASRVIVGLPATKLFTRTLQLPIMNATDLNQAIKYEVEQYVPVPVADLYTDHEILRATGDAKGQMEVLMIAAPRAIVDSYIKLFDALGLEIEAVEANMAAVVRALLHSKDASDTTLVVDIGSVSSDLTIYDKVIPLTGSAPVGGEQYTQALMSQLNIKIDQATEIKTKFGLGPSDLQAKVTAALEPSLQTMVKEAKRMVKFYQGMPGIDTYFRTAVGLPLTVGDPWKNLKLHHPPASLKAEAPTFTTAVGLALRGLK